MYEGHHCGDLHRIIGPRPRRVLQRAGLRANVELQKLRRPRLPRYAVCRKPPARSAVLYCVLCTAVWARQRAGQRLAKVFITNKHKRSGTASSQRSPSKRIERIHCRVLCRSVRRSPDAHRARARLSIRVFTLPAPQSASRGMCRTGHASPGGSRRCQCSGRTAPAASARLRPSSGYRPRRC
jgi:hypothetical protein